MKRILRIDAPLTAHWHADAVATAYLGNNDTEDASKVVRDAVRTRPCMYTVRREAAKDTEKREIADRRTYGHMRLSAHEWVCEQYRKTTKPGSHTAGVEGRLWSEVAVASLKHPWDNKMRLPDGVALPKCVSLFEGSVSSHLSRA